MSTVEIREDLSLFDDAFSIHQQISEFQICSTTYDELKERIQNVKHPRILVAYVDNQPAGYVIGYERYSSFYIWLAGTDPNHRRKGILNQLMERVERCASELNYSLLTVKTRNSFKAMLLFLISNDFKLVDIDKRDSIDSHRLVLVKKSTISQPISSQ